MRRRANYPSMIIRDRLCCPAWHHLPWEVPDVISILGYLIVCGAGIVMFFDPREKKKHKRVNMKKLMVVMHMSGAYAEQTFYKEKRKRAGKYARSLVRISRGQIATAMMRQKKACVRG